MKQIFFLISLFISTSSMAQTLNKVWETSANVPTPESVLFHNGKLYISQIDGEPWGDDKKGGIGILSTDGQTYDGNWVTGLSAPKGMAILNNKLYVADITRLAIINIETGAIEKTIEVAGAKKLNDVAAGKGKVFVSDSETGTIWVLQGDVPTVYFQSAPGLNGLYFSKKKLYYGEGKSFKVLDKKKRATLITEVSEGIDGIEQLKNGDFLLSSWGGYIYYLPKNGSVQTVLETQQDKKNTADIGLDKNTGVMYVPTFFANTISAYQVSN